MKWLLVKYAITAGLVVLISEIAKRSDRLGGFIAALPTITILTLIWLFIEGQSHEKIANHAYYTFWYVIPTLPMFALFPWFLSRLGFWGALIAGSITTIGCFWLVAILLKPFGIKIL